VGYMLRIVLFVFLMHTACFAQTPSDTLSLPAQTSPTTQPPVPQASQRSGFRIDIAGLRAEVAEPRTGGIWRRFTVVVSGFEPKATDEARESTVHTLKTWLLYIDDQAMQGISPKAVRYLSLNEGPGGRAQIALEFNIEFNEEAKASIGRWFSQLEFDRDVRVSVGPAIGPSVQVRGEDFSRLNMILIPKERIILVLIGIGALLLVILLTAQKSNLLSDRSDPVATQGKRKGKRRYSLGMTQMAFWFLIVLFSYLFIGVVTGNWWGVFSPQSLSLMGIGALAAYGSTAINKTKREEVAAAAANLESSEKAIEIASRVATAVSEQSKTQSITATRLPETIAELQSLINTREQSRAIVAGASKPVSSDGFFTDLINEGDGPAFHRFQAVIWMAVLGGIFIFKVIYNLEMPEFDGSMLALMGISTTAYLGIKQQGK
jgi:hypothetical protein